MEYIKNIFTSQWKFYRCSVSSPGMLSSSHVDVFQLFTFQYRDVIKQLLNLLFLFSVLRRVAWVYFVMLSYNTTLMTLLYRDIYLKWLLKMPKESLAAIAYLSLIIFF